MKRSSALAVAACLTILAGCSGGGGGSVVPVAGAKTHATFTFTIPKQTAAAGKKRPAYLSPATQSVGITITPQAGGAAQTFNAGLTTSDGDCTSTLLSTVCTLVIGLDAGSYYGAFTTYDGPIVSGLPTGNALSTNQQLPITIALGSANVIPLSLDGLPTQISVAPLPGQSFSIGSQTAGFGILGDQTVEYSVLASDADGNYIVGPGAPVFSVQIQDGYGSGAFSVAPPTTQTPNTFSITSSGFTPIASVLDVQATLPGDVAGDVCGNGGIVCSVETTIGSGGEFDGLSLFSGGALALAASTNANITAVSIYGIAVAPDYTYSLPTYAAPFATASGAIAFPNDGSGGVAYATFASSGELFATMSNGDVYASQYPYTTVTKIHVATGGSPTAAVIPLANGSIAVPNYAGAGPTVTILAAPDYTDNGPIAPASSTTQYSTGADTAGNVFIASVNTSTRLVTLDEYSPPSYNAPTIVGEYTGGLSFPNPIGYYYSPSQSFTMLGYQYAESISPPYTTPVSISAGYNTFDPSGDVWQYDQTAKVLDVYSPDLQTLIGTLPWTNTPSYFIP